ncbi:hypothetical protein PYH37_003950 [Sinorhizobium numidicum]|uniref:DUF2946 domain-containing protein n=1 Tax=Sinorhizobium numidicum TaxID=680248 RepID=A0ABY8CZL5_9HYPH|nr:hypothetical protein [Sinorhizobium numidicum]WEX78980.1 hypothetical protein PYH37_003950 [Sinorhizobium numidicum]WEX82376.1 hypothetical protein PYH38_004662 [Sinorhizobium numidicum]
MGMPRITLQKMLILLRLVIVMSLAGYSLPTASAAMHGAWANPDIVASNDHHEMAPADHAHGDHQSSPDDAQKLVKQDCCKGFCVSMAIVNDADTAGGPRVASIREFADDAHTYGELPPLHRPPNI